MPSATLLCRVTRGELSREGTVAAEMTLDDLRSYWEKSFGSGSLLVENETPERKADLDLLLGSAGTLPRIATLVEQGAIENLQPPEQGFALDIVMADSQWTAVLRAADRLGLQYAIYGFAEHFLGLRFVHPLLDLQPETPPMPERLHLVESPSVPLRTLFDTSHVRLGGWGTDSKRAHFSDALSWRWEDWAGNPERLCHFLAWGIKNRANTVVFDDTMGNGTKAPWVTQEPFMVSQAVWDCMDARG